MTLGIRRRLLLVVIAAVVVSVAGLVAGFNIVLGRSLDRDSRDLVRSRAAAELGSIGVRRGHLTTSETKSALPRASPLPPRGRKA